MDRRVSKLIDICGFEKDKVVWRDVVSKLFNGLSYEELCLWHQNRDDAVNTLIEAKKKEVAVYDGSDGDRYFYIGSDDRVIVREPIVVVGGLSDFNSGVRIAKGKMVYLGEGVQLVDSTIRTNAYVGDGAKIVNSRIFSTKNREDEANYVGDGVVIEDVEQFCKGVVGSSIGGGLGVKYMNSYYHGNALNNAIIGGSTGVSSGCNVQSHRTFAEDTVIADLDTLEGKLDFLKVNHQNASRTPLIVGVNCRIGDKTQLVAPSIIGADNVVGGYMGHPLVVDGLVHEGNYYDAESACRVNDTFIRHLNS